MGPFTKYVTCTKAFFIPFQSTCVTLCQFYYIAFTVLLTENNKLWNERKKDFLYAWLIQPITLYLKDYRHIKVLKAGSFRNLSENFVCELGVCKFDSCFCQLITQLSQIQRQALVCFLLLLAVILSELHEKSGKKD